MECSLRQAQPCCQARHRSSPYPVRRGQYGCFNRPWAKWAFKETLAAIKSAGYTSMGLLTPTPRVVALPEIGG